MLCWPARQPAAAFHPGVAWNGRGGAQRGLIQIPSAEIGTGVQILAQFTENFAAEGFGKHLGAKVSGGNGVGFVDDKFLALVVMGMRHGKHEAEQETEKDIEAIAGGFYVRKVLLIAAPKVEAEIHTEQETQEKDDEKEPGMIDEPEQGVPVRTGKT